MILAFLGRQKREKGGIFTKTSCEYGAEGERGAQTQTNPRDETEKNLNYKKGSENSSRRPQF